MNRKVTFRPVLKEKLALVGVTFGLLNLAFLIAPGSSGMRFYLTLAAIAVVGVYFLFVFADLIAHSFHCLTLDETGFEARTIGSKCRVDWCDVSEIGLFTPVSGSKSGITEIRYGLYSDGEVDRDATIDRLIGPHRVPILIGHNHLAILDQMRSYLDRASAQSG
ncbi:MAG: hypothetical protein AAFX86_02040 [Pseudomonadota bacterium]